MCYGVTCWQAKAEDTLDLCQLLNDDLAKTVSKHPSRFVGLGTLPMQNPEMAVEELKRCRLKLGNVVKMWIRSVDEQQLGRGGLVRQLTGLVSDWSEVWLVRCLIDLMSHWSSVSLVRFLTSPISQTHWSDLSLVKTSHWSDVSLVRRLTGPTSHSSDISLVLPLTGPMYVGTSLTGSTFHQTDAGRCNA